MACMQVTPALDAWALGIVALELLAGSPVFDQAAMSTEQVGPPLLAAACMRSTAVFVHLYRAGG